jgi:hypothetical protein
MESIRRIMQLSTCLWGGIYNPIIPVCSTIPDAWNTRHFRDPSGLQIAKGYLDFFEPDVFVEAKSGLADQLGLANAKLDFGRERVLPLDVFFAPYNDHVPGVPFGLGIFNLYKDLYEREFKFVARHEHRIALFDSGSPEDDAFIEAAFGGFPKSGPLEVLSQSYADAFDPEKLAPIAGNWVKVVKERFRFPLHFTTHGISRDPDGQSDLRFFVVDPVSAPDLLDLWNIRQFYPHIFPVNVRWMKECRDFLTEFIKANYRPIPGNPYGTMIDTTVQFGRSIPEEDARAVAEEAGLTELPPGAWGFNFGYDPIWRAARDDFVRQPCRARVSVKSIDLALTVSREGDEHVVRFPALSPDFASPYGNSSARWVNVLKFRRYGTGETLALTLPSNFTGKPLSRWRFGGFTIVSREGFVLPQEFNNNSEYLRLMTGRQAVIDWLGRNGVTATPSDPGQIADQVLDALGGLWGAGLIADRDTLELLDRMAKSVRKHADGTVEEFPDRTADVKKWKELVERRANSSFARHLSLDSFIKANVLRLGISIQCPNCMKNNWCGLGSLREQVTCERCLKNFDFPQGSLDFKHTPWQYRVVGPFSVPNYASGAYSTALALRVFARTLETGFRNLTYSTGLDFKIENENPFEVDFTLWYQRGSTIDRDEEPSLVFGEAKSFAAEAFKNEDIARMKKLAEKFPGAFLVFATLKNDLAVSERNCIAALAKWGRQPLDTGLPRAPVIVLTGTELFANWNIKQTWKDLGNQCARLADHPSVRLGNLWTLADITQQVYLGLPDRLAELRAAHLPQSRLVDADDA